jgi:hypothetical protein
MKEFNIKDTGVKVDVAAIEWPANATALVYEKGKYGSGALVCCTSDPDESKEGAETSEIRITCDGGQVIGTLGLRRWRNDIIPSTHILPCGQPHALPHSSFDPSPSFLFLLFSYLVALCR